MRESIGGAWIYGLVLGFVLLFTSFISLAISYNKVFKVKNEVVSIIEKYNGVNDKNKDIIANYLKTSGYSIKGASCDSIEDEASKGIAENKNYLDYMKVIANVGDDDSRTMCIKKVQREKNVYVYDIVLFYNFNIPAIGDIFKFKITGQTEDIYYPNDTNPYLNKLEP